jgi:hypothetical protein
VEKRRRPKELYDDMSCKDAPVPLELLMPMCDCDKLAGVDQSTHESMLLDLLTCKIIMTYFCAKYMS